MQMKIGIIGAMPSETNLIFADMQNPKTEKIGMREYHTGKLYGKDAVVVYSRIGKVAAASTATMLIERYKVDIIIFAGIAGGVAPNVKTGDVIIGDKLFYHDMDVTVFGNPKYHIPMLDTVYLESGESLVKKSYNAAVRYINEKMVNDNTDKALKELLVKTPSVHIGTIATGDSFIACKDKSLEIYNTSENLKCVEMEGAAVAQVCTEHNIPFVVFRIISDGANGDAPKDFKLFENLLASPMTRGIIKELLKEII
jgi:adenosylhomocysteine nucleosidase